MKKTIAILCAMILPCSVTEALAQEPLPNYPAQAPSAPYPTQPAPAPAPAPDQTQMLSPQQLDNLVAPIALYPDPLLGQVLAASTYPLEIVEAQQWVGQHPELRGAQLTDAARQQNWDPSVQALVAFPDAMALLTRDIQWTTDLGNAFLAQQADVMSAIQRMRARAQQNGRLQSTPQETVTTQPMDNGAPPAIQIEPANPQVVYVPVYNPAYVWGPPVWGAYPPLWYPPVSFGFGFGPAIFLGSLFAGFLGFGGWGWGLNWLLHGLFLNNLFFHHFGFAGFGGGYGGRTWWAHNPVHRMGVAYPNRAVASRFGSTRYAGAPRSNDRGFNASRNYNARSYNNERGLGGNASRGFNDSRSYGAQRGFSGAERSFGGNARSFAAPSSRGFEANRGAERGFNGAQRGFNSSTRGFSNPGHFSAPRSSGGGHAQHFSAPKSSGGSHFGGHSGGGHSGGHSGGGKHR